MIKSVGVYSLLLSAMVLSACSDGARAPLPPPTTNPGTQQPGQPGQQPSDPNTIGRPIPPNGNGQQQPPQTQPTPPQQGQQGQQPPQANPNDQPTRFRVDGQIYGTQEYWLIVHERYLRYLRSHGEMERWRRFRAYVRQGQRDRWFADDYSFYWSWYSSSIYAYTTYVYVSGVWSPQPVLTYIRPVRPYGGWRAAPPMYLPHVGHGWYVDFYFGGRF